MSAAQYTARITAALHRVTVRLSEIAHGAHSFALQAAYNALVKEAAYLRGQLTALGQDTRDATIDAKIAYQKALKDAEDSFNAEVKRITDSHTAQRAIIVRDLDAINTSARSAHDAALEHDAAA